MAKEKLKIEANYEGFVLYGIASSAKEYRLAWQLNKFLEINLEMQEELVLEFNNSKSLTLLYYIYKQEYQQVKLIKNLAVENVNIKFPFLLPELKKFDYLLLYEGEDLDESVIDSSITQLKTEVSFIQYISKIELDSLLSADNLMF